MLRINADMQCVKPTFLLRTPGKWGNRGATYWSAKMLRIEHFMFGFFTRNATTNSICKHIYLNLCRCPAQYGKTRLTNNVNFGKIDFWKHALALMEDFHHFITVEFHVRALNVRIPSIARMVYMVGAPNRPYWREKRRHVTHFWLVDRDRVWLIKKYTAHCWRNVKECQVSQEDQPLKGILKGFLKSFLKGFFKGFEILLPSNNFLSNVKRVCIESSSCPYSVADTTKNKQQQKV